MRHQRFDMRFVHALRAQFFAHFVRRFAAHKGFGLGKHIAQQNFVVAGQIAAFFQRSNQVDRGNVGTLVQQLEESMLAVDTGFTPDNRAGFVFYRFAVHADLLAVRFHIQLLDKLGQAVQVLVVRGDDVAAAAEIVDVPNTDHRQQYRHILIQRRVVEVLIHQVGAVEHFDEVFLTQIQHNRQADGRPQAVTTAYPIPKFKHVGGIDTKLGHRFFVGGNRDKVLGDVFFVAFA